MRLISHVAAPKIHARLLLILFIIIFFFILQTINNALRRVVVKQSNCFITRLPPPGRCTSNIWFLRYTRRIRYSAVYSYIRSRYSSTTYEIRSKKKKKPLLVSLQIYIRIFVCVCVCVCLWRRCVALIVIARPFAKPSARTAYALRHI